MPTQSVPKVATGKSPVATPIGVLAALLLHHIIVLFGLAFPLGCLFPRDRGHLLAVLRQPLTRVVARDSG